jgi:glutathione S-transferase
MSPAPNFFGATADVPAVKCGEGAAQRQRQGTIMLVNYPYTALVIVIALAVYIWMSMRVGGARGLYKVQAPSVDGPPEFLRVYRVHMNTLEQLAIFLPAIVLFAAYWGDMLAALIGLVWPIGRIFFALAYYRAAEKRGPGFGVSFLASVVLLLGGLVGIVMRLAGAWP